MSRPNLIIDNNGVLHSVRTNYQPVVNTPTLVNQVIPSTRFAVSDSCDSSIKEILRFTLTTEGRIYDTIKNITLDIPSSVFTQVLECEEDVNIIALKTNGDLLNIVYHENKFIITLIIQNIRFVLPHHIGSSFLVLLTNDTWMELEIGTIDHVGFNIQDPNLPKFNEIISIRSGIVRTTRGFFVVCGTKRAELMPIITPEGTIDMMGFLQVSEYRALELYIICNGKVGRTVIPTTGLTLPNWIIDTRLNGVYIKFIEYTMNEPGLRSVVDVNGVNHMMN